MTSELSFASVDPVVASASFLDALQGASFLGNVYAVPAVFVLLLAVGAVVIKLAPEYTRRSLDVLMEEPKSILLNAFACGIALFGGMLVLGVVIAATGLPLAVIWVVGSLAGIVALAGGTMTLLWLGADVLGAESAADANLWRSLAVGATFGALVVLVPDAGSSAHLIAQTMGLGALLTVYRS